MGLSKHQEHSMNALVIFSLKIVLGLVRPILLSSLEKMGEDLFVCQIYVDDIIFGFTNKSFCYEFSKIMTDRFEISMMGVLTFFLVFQINQAKGGTFISQMKYTRDILKKFGMDAKYIGRVPLGHVNSLDGSLSLGLQRNKIP
jgi:hypothetical protein